MATPEELKQIAECIVGKPEESARGMCMEAGWSMRVIRTEKGDCVHTAEFRPNRILVVTNDGVITEVCGAG